MPIRSGKTFKRVFTLPPAVVRDLPTSSSSSAATQLTGLDWDGTAPAKRGLYWLSPPNMTPLTILMKKYPRTQTGSSGRFFCDFFWGNHGTFQWAGDYGSAYVGYHPYPRPDDTGEAKWELAMGVNFGTTQDKVDRDDTTNPFLTYNRWYSQALVTSHTATYDAKLYLDLPSVATSNTISNTRLSADVTPPTPSMVVGQTAAQDADPNKSWGGEVRWEETNSILRGFQFFAAALTEAQILAMAAVDTDASALTTAAAQGVSHWYLNMNPTPSDATDKSGSGHHPIWDSASRPSLYTA